MSSLRIAFCTRDQPGVLSGVNTSLVHLVQELAKCGAQVLVLCLNQREEEGATVAALNTAKIDTRTFYAKRQILEIVQWFQEQIARWKPDVFVANHVGEAFVAGSYFRDEGLPVVGILHSDDAFHYRLARELSGMRNPYRLSALVAVSSYLREEVAKHLRSELPVVLIPYGIPLQRNAAKPAEDQFRLLYTGRFSNEQKRIAEVTLALCRVCRELPGVKATMIGTGPDENEVRRIVDDAGMGQRVTIRPSLSNAELLEELPKFHAIVLLSAYEGLPLSLVEGMGAGLVPIVSEIRSGIPDVVMNGENGFIVSNGQGFVNAVRSLRENPAMWSSLSMAAVRSASRVVDVSDRAQDWIKFCVELRGKADKDSDCFQVVPPLTKVPPDALDLLHRLRYGCDRPKFLRRSLNLIRRMLCFRSN